MTCPCSLYPESGTDSACRSCVRQLYRAQNYHPGRRAAITSARHAVILAELWILHSFRRRLCRWLNDRFAFEMQRLLLIWRNGTKVDKLANRYLAGLSGRLKHCPGGKPAFSMLMIRLSSWVMLQRLPPTHTTVLQSPKSRSFWMISSVTFAVGSHQLWMN